MTALWLSTALAATLDVPGTYPTLEDAFDDANSGDIIEVDGAAVLAPESIDVDVDDITVRGVNGIPTLSPSKGVGVFILDQVTLTLEDLRLDGLAGSRLVTVSDSALTMTRVEVVDGFGTIGGGIWLDGDNDNVLIATDCTFLTNLASQHGGAIGVDAGDVTLTDCTFDDNNAGGDGGAVHFDGSGDLLVVDSAFSNGDATRGGALNIRSDGRVDISASTFVTNSVDGNRGGGAIYQQGTILFDITGSTFDGNTGTDPGGRGGGALHLEGATTVVTDSTFCDNQSASSGGAVYLHDGSLDSLRSVWLWNQAVNGGALWVDNGIADVTHDSFAQNSATAGQAMASNGTLRILDSYVFDHFLLGVEAIDAFSPGAAFVDWSGFDDNAGGDFDTQTFDLGNNLQPANAGLTPPSGGLCDRVVMTPPIGTTLDGAASDGGTIGALDPAPPDADGDGYDIPADCDDGDPNINPGAVEIVGDGIDQDCDGVDSCYLDSDNDGFGEKIIVASNDLDCDDPNETDMPGESCPGFDDNLDLDGDGVPDDCDICDLGPDDVDGDGDGVPDPCDLCPGQDDGLDTDGDGIPNGCDDCDDASGDTDGDGVPDDCDVCPDGDDTIDTDGDGTPDACDDDGTTTVPPIDPGLDPVDEGEFTGGGCNCSTGSGPWPIAALLGLGLLYRRRQAR